MNSRIFHITLLVVLLAAVKGHQLSLDCKFHGHSEYACVAIGLENHDENALFSSTTGDHATNKSDDSVVELVIKGQNVSFVPENVGKFLPNILRYEVKNSSLVSIKRNNFANLHKLETLIITNNFLESLNPIVFHDLTQLKHLRLSGNRLTQIHYSTFSNNVNLEVVTLDNNRISTIHEEQFMNLSNLKEIYLHNNFIEDLRELTFVNNEKLETIDLHNNKLKTIGSQLLIGLKYLILFDFSKNQCIDEAESDYKTIDELTDVFRNFCFPPYLEEYKSQIDGLEKMSATLKENLDNCDSQLEQKTSSVVDLQLLVDTLTEEKTSIDSEREKCVSSLSSIGNLLKSCKNEKEDNVKAYDELAENLTRCESRDEHFNERMRFINRTLADNIKNIDYCQLELYTLTNSIQLSGRGSQGKKVDGCENDKQKMILQIDEITKKLNTRDNEIKSLREENEKMKLEPETIANDESMKCNVKQQQEDFQALQAQLSTCMTQLPMCNSFFIQCSFHHISEVDEYVCSAKHVSACQPGMKLTVEGTHFSPRSNNDVNVIEIRDSIFHFTDDLINQLPHLRKIKVQNGGLSTLEPKLKSSYLKAIEIFGNKFTEVPSLIFSKVNQLESLQLENNEIELLYRDSFSGLAKLLHLNLKDNKIIVLPSGVFDGLTHLAQLSMKHNRLTTLSGDLLKSNAMLQILKFDENSDLRFIGSTLLNYSQKFKMVQFGGTCVGTSNDDDVESVKRGIELYCRK